MSTTMTETLHFILETHWDKLINDLTLQYKDIRREVVKLDGEMIDPFLTEEGIQEIKTKVNALQEKQKMLVEAQCAVISTKIKIKHQFQKITEKRTTKRKRAEGCFVLGSQN
jgi:hypothetical protein